MTDQAAGRFFNRHPALLWAILVALFGAGVSMGVAQSQINQLNKDMRDLEEVTRTIAENDKNISVIANDVSNIKEDIGEIKDALKGLNRALNPLRLPAAPRFRDE